MASGGVGSGVNNTNNSGNTPFKGGTSVYPAAVSSATPGSAQAQTEWSDVIDTPTTWEGYGITDLPPAWAGTYTPANTYLAGAIVIFSLSSTVGLFAAVQAVPLGVYPTTYPGADGGVYWKPLAATTPNSGASGTYGDGTLTNIPQLVVNSGSSFGYQITDIASVDITSEVTAAAAAYADPRFVPFDGAQLTGYLGTFGVVPNVVTVADADYTTNGTEDIIVYTSLTASRTITFTEAFPLPQCLIVDASGNASATIKILGVSNNFNGTLINGQDTSVTPFVFVNSAYGWAWYQPVIASGGTAVALLPGSSSGGGGVSSFNTRTGAVVPASGDYSVSEVTGAAPLASPTFTGTPAAPTASPGTNTTQIATTAFVEAAVAGGGGGVTSFKTRTGAVVPASGDYTVSQVTGAAPLASPTFTGTPNSTTNSTATDSSTQIATDAFVQAALQTGWPFSGYLPASGLRVTSTVAYTVVNSDAIIVSTAASNSYPSITLPAAGTVGRQILWIWAAGTWGQNQSSQGSVIPNGTDTINGVNANWGGISVGYGSCLLTCYTTGKWVAVNSGLQQAFSKAQQLEGTITFLGSPVFSSAIAAVDGINIGGSGGTFPNALTVKQNGNGTIFNVTNPGNATGQGTISVYGYGTTAGAGVAAIYKATDLTAQAAAQAATTLVTLNSGTVSPYPTVGMVRVSYTAVITQAATSSSTLGAFQVIYTDNDTNTTITTAAGATSTANAVGTRIDGIVDVYAKAGTAVQFSFGYASSGATPMQYALHIRLEYLG